MSSKTRTTQIAEGTTPLRFRGVSHPVAKLLLEHAETFLDREEATRSAMALGMPLDEIQSYLDWLDQKGRHS